MLENVQQITAIEANKRINLYCPLGSDYYTADVYIKFAPNEYYMDYIDLDKFIVAMSGGKYTIEDAAHKIYTELMRYEPEKCAVQITAYSNTHLNVTVTKGDIW